MKKSSQAVLKEYSPDETRAMILQRSKVVGDLGDSLKRCSDILPVLVQGNKKEKEKVREEFEVQALSVMFGLEVETHVGLMESVNTEYRGMAKELTSQLIKEYDCTTHAEKMLVESAVSGFIQHINNSKRFNSCMNANAGEEVSSALAQFLSVLGKQIDRTNRQFLSSIAMLKQMKQPQLEINIKTKNAYVAENQQINHNPPQL